MMHGIAQDFVRYVMHVQVVAAAAQAERRRSQNVQTYSAPTTPIRVGRRGMQAAALAGGADDDERRWRRAGRSRGGWPAAARPPAMTAGRQGRVGEDAAQRACPCGSGKKFKLCHGGRRARCMTSPTT